MNESLKGYLSENHAEHELLTRNYSVFKPLVDMYGYDYLIEVNGSYKRLQVRSAHTRLCNNKYRFSAMCSSGKYTNESIDFFLCHVADINAWYIIPVDAVAGVSIDVYPDNEEAFAAKYEIYRDAWSLLNG